jgi:hypothetical protein
MVVTSDNCAVHGSHTLERSAMSSSLPDVELLEYTILSGICEYERSSVSGTPGEQS